MTGGLAPALFAAWILERNVLDWGTFAAVSSQENVPTLATALAFALLMPVKVGIAYTEISEA